MKNFINTMACLALLTTTPAWAEAPDTSTAPEAAACENIINISVNGLVCDFCARALEKVFGKRDDVTDIQVDMNKSLVSITATPEHSMDDATITKLITDSGYNVAAIEKGC